MAASFLLANVIVLTLLKSSCSFHSDDLLDRVRVSKSNDPEVRDFLKDVLKHHGDFRWIQDEATRVNREDQILPLHGVHLKKKRSFHAHRKGRPNYAPYGYQMQNSYRPKMNYQRPINDVYPYDEEEENSLRREYLDRLYREPNDDNMENRPYDDIDFLGREEPDANYSPEHIRKARSVEQYDGELKVPEFKRNNYADMLLNEKLMLRNLLHSNNAKSQKLLRNLDERNGLSDLLDQDSDEIRVEPNSEYGVIFNKGNRFRTDNYKRCINDEHILNSEFDRFNGSNDFPMAEFYYSAPHDILGIDQDMQMEQHGHNGTCFKFKRGIQDLLSKNRKDKGIKIKIFDDSRMVKDIKKGDVANSIVLTIKNDKLPTPKNEEDDNALKVLTDLNSYSKSLYSPFNNDNTLQKIDSMIKHDEATLKQKKAYLGINDHMGANDLLHLYENHPVSYKIERKSIPANKASNMSNIIKKAPTLKPGKEITHTDKKRKDYQTDKTLFTKKQTIKEDKNDLSFVEISSDMQSFSTEPQNRLEDQTEPTSAAEQRQLGKINNKFETPTLDAVSTEKLIIIPFKKDALEPNSNDQFDQFDDSDFSFQVDPSKSKKSEAPKTSSPLLYNTLKESNEVMNKLKTDLEKAIKIDLTPKGKDDGVHDNSDLLYDQYEDLVSKTEKSHLEGDDNFNDNGYNDDGNVDNITDESKKAKKQSNKKKDDKKKDSFQSRKLKALSKRNVFNVLGMSNDEDYSEDKIDYYDAELKQKRAESEEDDFETTIKHYFSTTPKRKVKNHAKKNTKHLTKSEIKKYKRYQKLKKMYSPKDKIKYNRNNYLHKRDLENDDAKKRSKGDDDNNEDNQDDDEENVSDNGNELDIIEKSQAILLHITNPPVASLEKEPLSTNRGDMDDEPNSKFSDRSQKSPQHSRVIKLNNENNINNKDDDIIGEILKIVNTYKDHELKKQKQKKEKDSNQLSYDNDDDVAFSHHQHKNKKNHPELINVQCKVKEGTDHTYHLKQIAEESEYQHPKEVKEGFAEIESVADSEESLVNKRNFNKKLDENINKEKRELADRNIFKNNQIEVDDSKENDNPRSFTPDNVDSFRGIIEPHNKRKLKYLAPKNDDLLSRKKRNIVNDHRNRIFKNYDYSPYYYQMMSRIRHQADEYYTSPLILYNSSLLSTATLMNGSIENVTEYVTRNISTTSSDKTVVTSTIQYSTSTLSNTSIQSQNLTNSTAGVSKTCQTICVTPEVSTTIKDNICSFLEKPDDCKASPCKTNEQKEHDMILEHKKFKFPFGRNKPTVRNKNKFNKYHSKDKFQDYDGDVVFDNRKDKEPKVETDREQKMREKSMEKLRNEKDKDRTKEREHLKSVLNGHLILEIFETLLTRLKTNEPLYNRFGQSIGKKCATDQIAILDTFRDEQSKKDIKHAQLMLHQVIVMMNKIVADQVHRRMCVVLAPTLKEYLKRAVTVGSKNAGKTLSLAEGFPLPQIKDGGTNDYSSKPDEPQGDFLFENPESTAYKQNVDLKMRKKINMIKTILNKYHNMSENCQVKVEPVRDYLVQHLEMLEKIYKDRKNGADDTCTVSAEYLKKCNSSSLKPDVSSTESTIRTTVNLTTIRAQRRMHPYELEEFDDIDRYNKYYNNNGKVYSDKYRRLVEAATNYRRKRQIDKRLARLFGRRKAAQMKSDKGNKINDIRNVAFESPMIFNLDE